MARPDGGRAHADVAADLSSAGLRRVSDGWAAYMVMGRALARQPQDAGLIGSYLALVQAAGLQRPSLPCEAVAAAPQTEQEAVALGTAAAELGPLLAQLSVAVDPDGIDAVMALLEPVFGASALDVAVVPAADPVALAAPGRLGLALWGSPLAGAFEAAGVPVHPIAIPDPFLVRPDAERWETVDAAACLP